MAIFTIDGLVLGPTVSCKVYILIVHLHLVILRRCDGILDDFLFYGWFTYTDSDSDTEEFPYGYSCAM